MVRSAWHLIMLVLLSTTVAACSLPDLSLSPTETPPPPPPPASLTTPTAAAPMPDSPADATVVTTQEQDGTASESLLTTVGRREVLRCGVNADLPGFGFYDSVRDEWSGFDVDFCRVVAAAVLGDADGVEFVPLTADTRWEAIRNGDVDVLFRNSTWTAARDTAEGVDFGPTTFHDGQGFLVATDGDIATVGDLNGRSICVIAETTSAANLRDELPVRDITSEIQTYPDAEAMFRAYDDGACDAVSSDRSQLISLRERLRDPVAHTVLAEQISREPLGPAYRENDSEWQDAVNWAVFATVYAEELRVDQRNIATLRTSDDPRIRRLLGQEGSIGDDLGLRPTFAADIITQVGNYADIYNRNLGPDTRFALDRGPNKVWNLGQGGVLAAPPFR